MALRYGIVLPQGWAMELADIKDPVQAYETMTRVAQTAEECGYASIWLVDHFHTIPQPSQEVTFECWTSLAALARDTRRVRIGPMVSCNSYRHPALLAKMASTVDVLSHGRLTLGIGAGWHEQEYRAYGYDYPEAKVRLQHLREAVQVVLAMWTEPEATFTGTAYQVCGAINQPKGVQQPHIPLLIGGSGEHVTLKLVAQYADACNVEGDCATLAHKFAVLKGHCEAVGRDYQRIRRTTTTLCLMDETDEQALAQIPEDWKEYLGDAIYTDLIGSPATIRQRLATYEEVGVQELLLKFVTTDALTTLQRFAAEFIG